jgi:hypothetical protein
MKKIVLLSMFIGCLPLSMMAQSEDDLYYVPSKDAPATTTNKTTSPAPTTVEVTPSSKVTTVIVRNHNNARNSRSVDEYNRHKNSDNGNSSSDNGISVSGDTLYIDENGSALNKDSDLNGKWVSGFDGSNDDYEYATRIIRFRNPRFAVSVSSPYYWDIVYGLDSWDWNIYDDGFYAYAFPRFSNPLWSNWRFNSIGWGWGWNYGMSYYGYGFGWDYPYYAYNYPYYGGWYGGGYYGGGGRDRHFADVSYRNDRRGDYGGNGGNRGIYTRNGNSNLASRGANYNGNSSRRYENNSIDQNNSGNPVRRGSAYNSNRSYSNGGSSYSVISSRRVVGARSNDTYNNYNGVRQGQSIRTDASSSRREVYTRPSSTRSSNYYSGNSNSNSSRSYTTRSYNQGNSSIPSRSYSSEGSSRRSSSFSSPSFSGGGGSPRSSSGGGHSGGGGGHSSRR